MILVCEKHKKQLTLNGDSYYPCCEVIELKIKITEQEEEIEYLLKEAVKRNKLFKLINKYSYLFNEETEKDFYDRF